MSAEACDPVDSANAWDDTFLEIAEARGTRHVEKASLQTAGIAQPNQGCDVYKRALLETVAGLLNELFFSQACSTAMFDFSFIFD